MKINSKYKKHIITALAGTILAVGMTGCSNDKKQLSDKDITQEAQGELSDKEKISIEKASTIIYDKLNESDLWWEFKEEWKDYYVFEETSVGADYRYLVNMYTGELFYESASAIGELIAFDDVSDETMFNVGPKEIKLVETIRPKLKNRKGIEKTKLDISSKVQGIIKKHGFEISDATETNDLVIVDSEYEKYTEKYNQLMYYLVNEDYSKGIAHLNFNFEQEMHNDTKITEDDNFVKLLHEMYTYLTGSDIKINSFATAIQKLHETGVAPAELTEEYLGLSFENESMGGSRNKLAMRFYAPIDGLMKTKYPMKKYDTVADYKEFSEKKSKEMEQFSKSNYYTLTEEETARNLEKYKFSDGAKYILFADFNYGKNSFMQTGEIVLEPRSENYLASQSDIDLLHNALKSVLGEELYNNLDKSNLTLDYINKAIRSAQTKLKYKENLSTNDLGESISWSIPMEMSNAEIEATAEGVRIKFSIPVEAEGIRGL